METHTGDGDALPMSAEEEALGTISTVEDDGGQLDLNIPYERYFPVKNYCKYKAFLYYVSKKGGVNCSGITEDASAAVGSLGGETSITSSEITRLVFEYMSNLGRGVVAGMFFISIMVADKWRTLNTVSASLSC